MDEDAVKAARQNTICRPVVRPDGSATGTVSTGRPLMLAGVLPLPEDVDELAFAGYLRGSPTRTTRSS